MAFESVKDFADGKAYDHVSQNKVATLGFDIDLLIAGQTATGSISVIVGCLLKSTHHLRVSRLCIDSAPFNS